MSIKCVRRVACIAVTYVVALVIEIEFVVAVVVVGEELA